MRFSEKCVCGARICLDTTRDKGPYLIDGNRRDSEGRMYRAEKWVDDWRARHSKCTSNPTTI